jgi:hypothetical protein
MNNIQSQILFFQNKVETFEKLNTTISQGSVGWHIAHCCITMESIFNAVSASNHVEYSSKFNWKKFIVFFTNKIPRGKAKAPDRVTPREVPTKESLLAQLEKAKQKLKLLEELHNNAFFPHPYFGNLNLKETKKFLSLHNHHHSKIINDILK